MFLPRGGPPWQIRPQSAHTEDDGEERGHAEREQCPDEEEASAGLGDRADATERFRLAGNPSITDGTEEIRPVRDV